MHPTSLSSQPHTPQRPGSPRAFLPFTRNQGPWEPVVNHTHVGLTPALTHTLHQFWEQSVTLQFVGVGAYLASELQQGEPLYCIDVPQHPHASKALMLSVQLSEDLCLWLLENTLGGRSVSPEAASSNRLDHLTHLETTLLNAFCQQWVDVTLQGFGNPTVEKRLQHQPPIDFVWAVYHHDSQHTLGKVALQVPADILRHWLKEQPRQANAISTEQTVAENLYEHAQLLTVITLGSSRVHLNDLKHLDIGDVMVLENSDIDVMTLKDPRTRQSFEVDVQYPDWVEQQCRIHVQPQPTTTPRSQRAVPTQQELALMTPSHTASDMHDAFWNQLLIDVRAEFLPIRIPLNELKQLSEGLIMEVGDLANNTIRLHIDDKTIAEGELVIVGDKFGVRIKSIEEDKDDENDEDDEEEYTSDQPMISVVEDDEEDEDEDEDEGMPLASPPQPDSGGMPMESDSEDNGADNDDEDDELFDDEDDW